MDERRSSTKPRKVRRPSPAPADTGSEGRQRLHTLSNTLASLRLRLGILATDPSCVESQGENLTALMAIADDALTLARQLQPAIAKLEAAAARKPVAPRRSRSNGRG